jgi:outer membrane cobalamin receptor
VILLAAPLFAQQPATSDSITVTATRVETRLADTPASVVILDKEVIATSAAPTIDDTLREVPGFMLFRRSGSRVANPTAQGVSLRGVGASGASRAIVLDDGIPLNDPFGGWIFWGRVPRTSLERIEVLRGGASDRYGSGAMGGVVQFLRRRDDAIVADISDGSQSTRDASFFAAAGHEAWRVSLAADLFDTSGYVLVEPGSRGARRHAGARRDVFPRVALSRVAEQRHAAADERGDDPAARVRPRSRRTVAAGIHDGQRLRADILRDLHRSFHRAAHGRSARSVARQRRQCAICAHGGIAPCAGCRRRAARRQRRQR